MLISSQLVTRRAYCLVMLGAAATPRWARGHSAQELMLCSGISCSFDVGYFYYDELLGRNPFTN